MGRHSEISGCRLTVAVQRKVVTRKFAERIDDALACVTISLSDRSDYYSQF
jgi:hypothetical protein